ncbi:threonine--tRNA ligase [bacterium]|nr:threonine--tRNA ligase [bacterium]
MSYQIQFENGNSVDVAEGVRPADLYEEAGINPKKVIAAKIDDEIVELNRVLPHGGELTYIRKCDGKKPCPPESLHVLRHTAAHVMAQAVMRLFDNVEFAIGPTIEDGFYYDFDLEHRLSEEDFEAIEAEMKKIIEADYPVVRQDVSEDEAWNILGEQRATFKRELLKGLEGQQISFYSQEDFTDLCRGPHLPSTGFIGAFKLLSVAGAYWRGKETNPMLQRIYGTAFFTEKDLKKYLNQLEEAKKRDHKKLGAHLNLFMFDQSGPGFPFWQPKGVRLYREVEKLMYEKMDQYEYDMIRTPMILNEQLWRESGHWDHYRENMYFTEIDEKAYAVKPMNCPGGTRVFNSGFYSYRDLPVRQGEFGLVHRHEKSGVLSGLFRVRNFTQDDAHIYCTPDQVVEEVVGCLKMVRDVYDQFGFDDYSFELSTRPEKSIGTAEMWEMAESALEKALEQEGINYQLNPGDGAFYGPKIDVHIRDAIKRTWQCGTIQVDFSMPERFDLNYVNEAGDKVRPVMIHRAIYGSFERFIGILIEHFAGKFPTWLAPVQAVVLPISQDKFGEYANKVYAELKKAGVRVEVDDRNESLNKRIREQQKQYVPYMLVVGEREKEDGTVAVRRRDGVQVTEPIPVSEFAKLVVAEQQSRAVEMTIGAPEPATEPA